MLIDHVRRGRPLGHKRQLEVVDDTIDHRIVGEEGDDAHFPLALGADQGIDLIHLAANLGPAPAGDSRAFLLYDQELSQALLSFAHLPPMSIGIQAES